MITMVTGGARSGKSTYAESLLEGKTEVLYIACGVVTDEEMQQRVDKHRLQRPSSWHTMERYDNFSEIINDKDYNECSDVLLDCITTMITNLMMDADVDYDKCTMDIVDSIESSIMAEIDSLLGLYTAKDKHIIIVTNEVGLGLVPAYRMGRIFRDIQGRANQMIARQADEVYNVVSGIPVRIK